MGEGVCTKTCQEECPQGWSCKLLQAEGADPVSVCVSAFANLCKPCGTTEGCQSPGAAQDLCLDYGEEGSFCGGACLVDEDCPWGFSCLQAVTVEGVALKQCVADSGTCPCTSRSAALGLTTPCAAANESGECTGKRVCSESGLSDCDAPLPTAETCNGLDDDCDQAVDEPNEVDGQVFGTCDDGNECTKDVCAGAAGCSHEPLLSGECKDGDACTAGDHCEEGQCVGSPVLCDDQNPCTDDSCDGLGGCGFSPNTSPCDDGDPCTVADGCKDEACSGIPVACDCWADEDCEALDDGDACTGQLFCDQAKIPYLCKLVPGSVIKCPGPPQGPDAPCLASACEPKTGACSLVPANGGFACDDGDACTAGDKCGQGKCQSGPPISCLDDNPCTDDLCDAETGCLHTANKAPCNDGNACTLGDKCSGGLCLGGQPSACDDGDLCNGVETCDPLAGCQAGQPLPCDDKNPCNGLEICQPFQGCKTVGSGSCDDGNPCTDDSCDGQQGCLHAPNQATCDDGNACTSGDLCKQGKCGFSQLLKCDDGKVCTTDQCDPQLGCTYLLNSAPCDDGNLCTTGDHCHLGGCIGGNALPCDDTNPCTDDSCDPKAGCKHLPNKAPCNDDDPCTDGDACSLGWCLFTGFVDCSDGKVCNGVENCEPQVGCVAGIGPNLDDGLGCTFDYCDEALGGVGHAPMDGSCDDGLYCNGKETCSAKSGCLDGPDVPTADAFPCTVDTCDEELDAVVHTPEPALCNDANACNGIETCVPDKGCQSGQAPVCDDGVACTADTCLPASGCLFVPNNVACEDSNPCTTDTCVLLSGCKHGPLADGVGCTINTLPGKCQGGKCVADCQPGSQTFLFTGAPATYALPSCATNVTIEAWGAAAGAKNPGNGGKGAYMKGGFQNLAGQTLEIRVGGKGKDSQCSLCGGGGGGGSFVWVQGAKSPLLIAGGGGGTNYQNATGQPGLTTEASGAGGHSSSSGGLGGTSDNGHGGGCGGGGGGWISDGASNNWATGGKAQGGAGGSGPSGSAGGFGGGGGNYHGGGGGGGYSGGGGGIPEGPGGGGGSYNAGSKLDSAAGNNPGDGKIIITWQ
jgi:hypothetical protein